MKKVPVTCPSFATVTAALDKLEAVSPADSPAGGDGGNGAMDVEGADGDDDVPTTILPEVEVYLFNLLLTGFLRQGAISEAVTTAVTLMTRVQEFNCRSLDLLSSKFFFYFSLCFEKANTSVPGVSFSSARPALILMYRRACVRRDEMGQATLLNLLLRNYLYYDLYEQADTLASKAPFPESASNNQFCRYLYYMGRIAAVQLEYSDAHIKLLQASRKAPTNTAAAFTAEVTQLSVIVQLLMGDIPPTSTFRGDAAFVAAMAPYEALTQAVKNGDLEIFAQVAAKHADALNDRKNLSLVQRLQHNVLKTGLRKISISYARISIADVAKKLHIDSHKSMVF